MSLFTARPNLLGTGEDTGVSSGLAGGFRSWLSPDSVVVCVWEAPVIDDLFTYSAHSGSMESERDSSDIIDEDDSTAIGMWIAIGIAIGVAIGAAIDNVGLGIVLGVVFGAAIGTYQAKRD